MTQQGVLEVRVDRLDLAPTLTTVCPGYEAGRWRAKELVRDLFDRHLMKFALPYSDHSQIDAETAAAGIRKAAKAVYETEKYQKRGEFGELILHAIACDVFGSQPAISKIYFKDSANDTVKGFDAVHVVEADDKLELWLGEVKFYQDLRLAIRDVAAELVDHLQADYLRSEFTAITNKLDSSWPHSERVRRILHENTSLDEVFDTLTIPVLLTYDSDSVGTHNRVCPEYEVSLATEAQAAWDMFVGRIGTEYSVTLRLILLPLHRKTELIDLFHERLRIWQQV